MTMPAVALRGMTILPGMIAHFDISREKSLKAIEEAMRNDQQVFLVTQKDVEQENPGLEDLYEIGIVAEVRQVIKMQNNIVRILVEGTSRAKVCSFTEETEYLKVEIEVLEKDSQEDLSEEVKQAMVESLVENFLRYAKSSGKISVETQKQVHAMDDLEKILDYIPNNLPVSYKEKQKVLEAVGLEERYEVLMSLLLQQIDVNTIKNDFQRKIKEKIDKNQKDYILREQMSLIRQELGEDNTTSTEADEFMEKTEKLKASTEVKTRLKKEIGRFRNVSSNSSESTVIRGYIETLLELPWDKSTKDSKDLDAAQEILDRDHYGLEKVKERIMEFLAVRNLTSKGQSPIICLVGPPGTGKTSIARSVAEALNKKYVRICLGGVRDEAEIRGHRKTYVGAMPGRIIQGIKQAGVKNPLMLFDEIDKLGSDYKGDPSSALLEVLDSEQNNQFRDHYVELPVDLSEVLFIATANSMDTIPKPLLDRMEIIEISSYTENEKFHIAKDHLWEKQLTKNGLKPEQVSLGDAVLKKVIHSYTKEAGVRSLERKLGEICRKCAREIYQKKAESVKITINNLEKYLGKEKYAQDKKNENDEVGIVRGLAWTSVGGVTLEIEVNVMPGKGEFVLTGKLGDVMKESASAGISYIRSISQEYGVDPEFFQKNDIHIHIPEGAVPKDGPSAGITMATAMLSAITGKKVRSDIAMTGEITLRGRVLPIGGLKEKLLAAKNAQMKTVCIPKGNEKDLPEISAEIKKGLNIIPVEHMKEVIQQAFV